MNSKTQTLDGIEVDMSSAEFPRETAARQSQNEAGNGSLARLIRAGEVLP